VALTTDVKAELVSIRNAPPTVRVAEVTAILRFAGGLHSIAGRVAVEAEVATPPPSPIPCGATRSRAR